MLNDAVLRGHGKHLQYGTQRVKEREKNTANAKETDPIFRQMLADKKHQHRCDQRKQRDQPEMREEIAGRYHSVNCLLSGLTISANPFRPRERFRDYGKTR